MFFFFFGLQIAIKGMRYTQRKKKQASKQTTKTTFRLTQCWIFCCCCYCNVQKLFTSDQTALIYKIKQTNLHHKFIAEQYRHIDGHLSNQQWEGTVCVWAAGTSKTNHRTWNIVWKSITFINNEAISIFIAYEKPDIDVEHLNGLRARRTQAEYECVRFVLSRSLARLPSDTSVNVNVPPD